MKSHDFNNNLVEILTGEGKSVTLAITSSILAIFGCDVSIACYSHYLCSRDNESFKKLFETLGIVDKITYGTFNQLCEQVINKSMNIRDVVTDIFNGKKIDTKVKKPSSLNPQVLLIDEVDVFFSKEFYGNTYSPSAVIQDPSIKDLVAYLWSKRNENLRL